MRSRVSIRSILGPSPTGHTFVRGVRVNAAAPSPSRTSRDDSDGYPTPPCQVQQAGVLRDILWPVTPGTRRFSIFVRHPGFAPTPYVVVRANYELGVWQDVVARARETTEWHQIVAEVNVMRAGVLEVWRVVPALRFDAYARWDNISLG